MCPRKDSHKPKLIFLDEPTVAVDPQSRNHILEGIKKLRENGATILYTTHYMEEVEQICDRIIIIDKGRIIAEGTSDSLKKLANIEEKISVEIHSLSDVGIEKAKKLKYATDAVYDGTNLIVSYGGGRDNMTRMIDFLRDNDYHYKKLYSERPTLNDVFLELTGKELRD